MVKNHMKLCRLTFNAGKAGAIIALQELVRAILSAFMGF